MPGTAGAGIENEGTLTVTNSTFWENVANQGAPGGGIGQGAGSATVTNSTFQDNEAPEASAIASSGGTVTVLNSILADSTVFEGGNCLGISSPNNFNISDDGTCGFGTQTAANDQTIGDNVSDANIILDSAGLANNGGPTDTIALDSGGFAVNAIPIANCPDADQRGKSQPDPDGSQTACDVGALS